MHLCELDSSDGSIRQAHREARDSLGSNCIVDRLEEDPGELGENFGKFQTKKVEGGGRPPINFLSQKDTKNTTQTTRSQLTTFIMFPQASTLYGAMQIYFPLFPSCTPLLLINEFANNSRLSVRRCLGEVVYLLLLGTNSITLRYSSGPWDKVLEFWAFETQGRNGTDSTQLGINGRIIY